MEITNIILGTIALVALILLFYKERMYKAIIKDFIHAYEAYSEERKDLLNRIMAKDLNDYKNVNNNVLPKGNNHIKPFIKDMEFDGLYE